ncbi:MAG: hypothetical protein AAF518_01685 [Spirochaetota bacterium]
MLLDKSHNRDLSGFVVIACKKIRKVVNIELLNYFSSQRLDDDIQFYIDQMPGKIYDREIDFLRADRLRKIAAHYVSYRVYYSFSNEDLLQKCMDAKNKEDVDNQREFDFMFSWETDNLIEDYNGFVLDLQKLDTKKVKLPCYCKIKDLQEFLNDYIEYGEILKDSFTVPPN